MWLIKLTTVIPFVIFPQKAIDLAFSNRREHDNGQGKMLKFLFYRGKHYKGGIRQRVLRYLLILIWFQNLSNLLLKLNL